MKRLTVFGLFIAFGMSLVLSPTVHAQTQDAPDNLDQLTQKPVAVDKLVEATGDPERVQELARSLNEGGVDPSDFNQTVSGAAQTGSLEGITEVGSFVNQQVEEGLRGEELAQSIHQHLNENFGIPAGGPEASGPPPIAQNFIPEQAQQRLRSNRGQRPSNPGAVQQPGSSNRPGSVGGPPGRSGPPAGTRSGSGGPPSSPGQP